MIKFMFSVFARNPPSILFVLAAFALFLSTLTGDSSLAGWVGPFFAGGMFLQILWILKHSRSR